MALVEYPTQLPMPDLSGYELNPVSPFIRTNMESGRARQRRRFTSVPVMVPFTITLKNVHLQIFEGWFRWLINDGVDWFMGPAKTALGVRNYEMRFTQMYRLTPISPTEWLVTTEIELRERQTVGKDLIEFPDFILYANIIDLAINREWPEK